MAEPSAKRQKVDVDVEKLQKRVQDLEHEAAWWEGTLDLWKEGINHHATDNLGYEYWLEYNKCRCCEKECDYTKGEGCGGKTVDGVLYCGEYNPNSKYHQDNKNKYLIEKASGCGPHGLSQCVCRNDASSDALWNTIKNE